MACERDVALAEIEALLALPAAAAADRRRAVARAMAIEVYCVLCGWLEGDEDLRDLSQLSLAQVVCSRVTHVAAGR